MHGFDLGQLEVLEILLQEQSVSKAAARLHLTPSAVSRSLSKIRAALGDDILTQAGRGLVLTQRGSEMKSKVRRMADEARALFTERTAFDPASMKRTFLIRTNDYLINVLGAELMTKVRGLAPLSTICFLGEGLEDVESYRNDQIEFDLGAPGTMGPELITTTLFKEVHVCAQRAKRKIGRVPMSLKEFCKRPHVIVSRRGKTSVVVDSELLKIGRRRSVVGTVATFLAGLDIAASSDCLVVAPEKLVLRNAKRFGLAYSPLPIKTPLFTICLTWHPRHQGDLGHRWLRNLMHEIARTL
jgi:DNA-binding transcriptional LysR family regulator